MPAGRRSPAVAEMMHLLRWYTDVERILEPEELWALLDKQKPPAKAADPTEGLCFPSTHDERYCLLEPPSAPTVPTVRLGVVIGAECDTRVSVRT